MKQPNVVSGLVVDASIEVHSVLGPGLLESAYEKCLAFELRQGGCVVASQVLLPLTYKGISLDVGYRIDLLVEDTVIVEIKTTKQLGPVDEAQLLSYLKLSGKKVGLLINFHVPLVKDGIKRMVNGL